MIHLILVNLNEFSNSSEYLNLTLWMPIREWINSNRSRSYVLSHSTCDTVLKKYFKSLYILRYRNTEKEPKKKTRKTTHCYGVSVCVLISFADLVNIFFPIVNTEPKQNAKHFYARDCFFEWIYWMKCFFFGVSLFLCCTALSWFIRMYNYSIFGVGVGVIVTVVGI